MFSEDLEAEEARDEAVRGAKLTCLLVNAAALVAYKAKVTSEKNFMVLFGGLNDKILVLQKMNDPWEPQHNRLLGEDVDVWGEG
jgi:hypothetical protein